VNAEQLALWLEHRLPGIPTLHLNSGNTRVAHILNWGGFVNHSFSVSDGTVQYHLKLTNDLDSIARLQRWRAVHDLLERRYRAPELIQWIDLSEIGFAGLLFQHLECRTAEFNANPAMVEQLIALADCLHKYEDIRFHIQRSGSGKTYLDHFDDTYIDRFTADLEIIAAGQLPFLSSALLIWMREETERLLETASRMGPFQHPAVEAVHGDLNEGNVLITADNWFVVDWDDLAIGDPAIDLAILLWPMVWEGSQWRELLKTSTEYGFPERMEVCFRAQLLDEVIDPLADFVAACAVPSKQAAVQLVKRKRHEEALEKYRIRW
jgi:hypothetical protein